MKNAELIVQMLEKAGVRWAFGIPSGPVLPLIEAMRNSSIEYVLTANETSAGFMAHTIGALTGVPGVCVSTVGPGATNLATGVGAAWLDRAPVIAITCNVETPWLERRIQMRIDHHALFAPLTKASLPLRQGSVAASLAEALTLALSDPPGPVHLDLPEDVAAATATESPIEPEKPPSLPPMPAEAFEKLSEALAVSRRPLLIGGLGLSRTSQPHRLLEFVEKQGFPFILTLHAKGFVPESSSWYAGVLGRARRSDVQAFVRSADLIIAVGYDPIEINYEDWTGGTPIVHLGTEPAETSDALRFVANAGGSLDGAIDALAALPATANDWTEDELQQHRELLDAALRPDDAGFAPHIVLDALRRRLPADGVLVYDVGAHTHQIATQWRTDLPNACFSTNGWSSMGFGLPGAFAAKLAWPDRTVVAVVGDGCFQMTAGELTVARRLGLPVPVIVLNDGWLSLLKVKQERKNYGLSGVNLGPQSDAPPHYFGVPCRGVHDSEELQAAIEWGLGLDGPSVIEAFVDGSEYSKTVYD